MRMEELSETKDSRGRIAEIRDKLVQLSKDIKAAQDEGNDGYAEDLYMEQEKLGMDLDKLGG